MFNFRQKKSQKLLVHIPCDAGEAFHAGAPTTARVFRWRAAETSFHHFTAQIHHPLDPVGKLTRLRKMNENEPFTLYSDHFFTCYFHGHFPLQTVQLHYHKGLEPQIEISLCLTATAAWWEEWPSLARHPLRPGESWRRQVMEHDHGCLEDVPETVLNQRCSFMIFIVVTPGKNHPQ